MQEQIDQLQIQLNELREWQKSMESSSSIPLNIDRSLVGRGFVKGTSYFAGITPLTGAKVYYVADSSGGAVTRKLTFTNGILTSQT